MVQSAKTMDIDMCTGKLTILHIESLAELHFVNVLSCPGPYYLAQIMLTCQDNAAAVDSLYYLFNKILFDYLKTYKISPKPDMHAGSDLTDCRYSIL